MLLAERSARSAGAGSVLAEALDANAHQAALAAVEMLTELAARAAERPGHRAALCVARLSGCRRLLSRHVPKVQYGK